MSLYTIIADPDVNASAVSAIWGVPLAWTPYVGVDAWGDGSPLPVLPRTRPPVQDGHKVYFCVTADQFYDSATDAGLSDPTVWNEARAAATLSALSGVTVQVT